MAKSTQNRGSFHSYVSHYQGVSYRIQAAAQSLQAFISAMSLWAQVAQSGLAPGRRRPRRLQVVLAVSNWDPVETSCFRGLKCHPYAKHGAGIVTNIETHIYDPVF